MFNGFCIFNQEYQFSSGKFPSSCGICFPQVLFPFLFALKSVLHVKRLPSVSCSSPLRTDDAARWNENWKERPSSTGGLGCTASLSAVWVDNSGGSMSARRLLRFPGKIKSTIRGRQNLRPTTSAGVRPGARCSQPSGRENPTPAALGKGGARQQGPVGGTGEKPRSNFLSHCYCISSASPSPWLRGTRRSWSLRLPGRKLASPCLHCHLGFLCLRSLSHSSRTYGLSSCKPVLFLLPVSSLWLCSLLSLR